MANELHQRVLDRKDSRLFMITTDNGENNTVAFLEGAEPFSVLDGTDEYVRITMIQDDAVVTKTERKCDILQKKINTKKKTHKARFAVRSNIFPD